MNIGLFFLPSTWLSQFPMRFEGGRRGLGIPCEPESQVWGTKTRGGPDGSPAFCSPPTMGVALHRPPRFVGGRGNELAALAHRTIFPGMADQFRHLDLPSLSRSYESGCGCATTPGFPPELPAQRVKKGLRARG